MSADTSLAVTSSGGGKGDKGACAPGGTVQRAAFRGAKKDWNRLVFHLNAVSILKVLKC